MDEKRKLRGAKPIISLIAGLLILALILTSGSRVSATDDIGASQVTFTVNSTADPGSGGCDATECTLREAINAANVTPGSDTIAFNIPGPGPYTIQPTSALPAITDTVVINGYTQPGASPNTNPPGSGFNTVLRIELNGSSAGAANVDGINIITGTSTVRGLAINRFSGDGIALFSSAAVGNLVEGNFVGTDVTGTLALGNGGEATLEDLGVRIGSSASGNTVRYNLISGNVDGGLSLDNGAFNNTVQGNLIGTTPSGTTALGNNQKGVVIQSDANNNLVQGNLISGNSGQGLFIYGTPGTSSNRIEGNFIGTDVTGTAALSNTLAGVYLTLSASNNTIGGTTPEARNVISGNGGNGVVIFGPVTTGNRVQGNYIGTDVTGTAVLGNGAMGVFVFLAPNNLIGGTTTGAGNLIAFNSNDGVWIDLNTTGNLIAGNAILSNGGLGIDLAPDGITLNDTDDLDSGANDLQNFPVLTSATAENGLQLQGTLNSTPNTLFSLEFFTNTACDPSGNGEGESFLGSTTVTTDGGGDVAFTLAFPTAISFDQQFVTATATDPDDNTSEFSPCVTIIRKVYLPIILR